MNLDSITCWLDRVDPGVHKRIKGLRLVTAYGIAALAGTLYDSTHPLHDGAWLGFLAGGFALWASLSEGCNTRAESSRDLVLLAASATAGATFTASLTPLLLASGHVVPELTLVVGAFLVGFLKRFGVLGAGIGSQVFVGQLLAYAIGLKTDDVPLVLVAGLIAAAAAIIPRVLSGPAEKPVLAPPAPSVVTFAGLAPEVVMGLQAAAAALAVVGLTAAFGLAQAAWAMAACTYVVTNTAAGTIARIRMRVIGTALGVPLGLACLPLAEHMPLLVWAAAALAMVVYSMALPLRYDIACCAYTFTLIVTLAASGEHSLSFLFARFWETVIGGALGLVAALWIFPLREKTLD